jgi:exoribonuclease-2
VEKGTLVEIKVNGDRRLVVIDKPEGKKDWLAIDENGNCHKIRPQKVEYEISGESFTYEEIRSFSEQVTPYLDESSLEIAWELLSEDSQPVTPPELATLIFAEDSPPFSYAAHLLLSDDKIYFKKKGNVYEPRPETQVAEIKHQLAIEAQKKQEKQLFIQRIKQVLAGEEQQWSEADFAKLNFVEKYVLQPENPPKQALEILEELNRDKTLEEAWQLLIDLKLWDKHENIFLRRSSYPNYFPLKVYTVAQSIIDQLALGKEIPHDDSRLDLTHHKVYTIDDESTSEIDDGLSVEQLEDGSWRYWIHVADPTRLISPHDELDLEARKRSTTLYLPTGMIPMFPPILATGPMSLRQGQVCPALSFGVRLDESGAILDYKIVSSWIKPTYRLTYQDADEMVHLDIQAEPEMKQLTDVARLREQWRKTQGSVRIFMPEAVIKVSDHEEISIEILDDCYSRTVVAEMMILAGEVAGHYCQEHNLPVPFRSQPQPELPPEEELLLLPAGPVRSCALRRCMPRSEMSLSPTRHSSLGLEAYIQVTSPIRRYSDLLAHFQIKAHLRGDELPFPRDEIQEILYEVTSTSAEATLVERQTNRYWSLEYLTQHRDEVWQALVIRWLREDDNLALILLEDLGLEFAHRFDRPVELGDTVQLKIVYCDSRRDEIRFREALAI